MLKSHGKRQLSRRILVLSLRKKGGARAPLAPPVPTALLCIQFIKPGEKAKFEIITNLGSIRPASIYQNSLTAFLSSVYVRA